MLGMRLQFHPSQPNVHEQIILIKNDIPQMNFELPTFSFKLRLNSARSGRLHQLARVIDWNCYDEVIRPSQFPYGWRLFGHRMNAEKFSLANNRISCRWLWWRCRRKQSKRDLNKRTGLSTSAGCQKLTRKPHQKTATHLIYRFSLCWFF